MSARTCVAPGCEKACRRQRRTPYCPMHQSRMDRHGSLANPRPTFADRLLAGLDRTGDCWNWTGSLNPGGYGQIRSADARMVSTHRASHELFVGPIPDGLHLDHLCRNRACANPHHLDPVTPGENVRRGEPANRSHCPQGHEYVENNTRVRNGKRHCLACHRVHQANYLARRAAAHVI